ncbi:CapA family protein [Streptococcus massiliensis]|uniref:Enzyme of poly-gamma-glutamate biosynthesis n=1 Tax=Streptococcus massiliensis TaxID=313439 RepID=A0A380KYM5_9STRE|nr:CapA family protein [Streptococcus massiliensis]SUN76671.1 enzyme of poly-gamma-glutamate biosynthesis [Streptococcus massiliensis]
MEKQNRKKQSLPVFIFGLLTAVALAAGLVLCLERLAKQPLGSKSTQKQSTPKKTQVTRARIMANGDLLYHDIIYMSARQADGTYDFTENYHYVTPWLEKANLVLGDFEGTINPNLPLAGYPLFNAPQEVAAAIKDAGYDVLDLAHNHILDSGLEGVSTTVAAFDKVGINTVGVYTKQERAKAPLLIKEVNGIKIAILAYSYGYNGLEKNISQEDYDQTLSNLDENKMKAEIERAEKEADITIVMPQMGVEYQLEPTKEQVALYHKMIEWGADIVFGGHPHVVEPAEIVKKGKDKKLIIYSMGNFLSNQRLETVGELPDAIWTERGVLMDVMLEKSAKGTIIKTAQAHPTWVNRTEKGYLTDEGYPAYLYQTYILEDFIEGGPYRNKIDEATRERVDTAYREMKEHVNLNWK